MQLPGLRHPRTYEHYPIIMHLRESVVLYGLIKPTPPVTTVHLAADNPEGLLHALLDRIGAAQTLPDHPVEPAARATTVSA